MKHSNASNFVATRSRFACACAVALASVSILISGCGTTTNRIATEQLLMSDAVDSAISQIDFRVLQGQKVFVDTLYLHSVKGVGFVNSEYIISSLRQQLTAAHCLIQDTREAAEIIVEPRVGALGTDGHDVVYGIPQSGSLANAAAAISSAPLPPIPEISFGKVNAQTGIAKLIVFAYNQETREAVWQSGIARAESTSRNTWYLGAGPFQKGSIHERTKFAGQNIPHPPNLEQITFAPFTHGEDPQHDPSEFVQYQEPYVFYDSQQIPAATPPDEIDDSPVQVAKQGDELEAKATTTK